MYEILIIIFLVIALAIIGLVLIQKGKGADMGASFGAGASATLFGSAGTGNFLTRTTTILGILFFVISLALANLGSKKGGANGDFWNLEDGNNSSIVTEQSGDANNIGDVTTIPEGEAIQQEKVNPTSDIPE